MNLYNPSYNLEITHYLGSTQYRFYRKPVFKKECVEDDNKSLKDSCDSSTNRNYVYESLKRSKTAIYDYARSNQWQYFITLTFSNKVVDRYDYKACIKKMTKFFNNIRSRKCKNLKYLIVHEFHKSGAVHLHGLLSNTDGLTFDMARNPTTNRVLRDRSKHTVYNWLDYNLGHCTATKVTNTFKVASYISKYITKGITEDNYIKNQKRYFVSKNLDLPSREHLMVDKNKFFEMIYSMDISYQKKIENDYNSIFIYEINE